MSFDIYIGISTPKSIDYHTELKKYFTTPSSKNQLAECERERQREKREKRNNHADPSNPHYPFCQIHNTSFGATASQCGFQNTTSV